MGVPRAQEQSPYQLKPSPSRGEPYSGSSERIITSPVEKGVSYPIDMINRIQIAYPGITPAGFAAELVQDESSGIEIGSEISALLEKILLSRGIDGQKPFPAMTLLSGNRSEIITRLLSASSLDISVLSPDQIAQILANEAVTLDLIAGAVEVVGNEGQWKDVQQAAWDILREMVKHDVDIDALTAARIMPEERDLVAHHSFIN